MLLAVKELNRLQREELHNIERPIAYLAFQTAEMNRDRKKRNKPFRPDDFYHYNDTELRNMPEPRYGAAMMELIKREQFPGWALFVFNELKKRADDALPPEVLCLQCNDAIILAPSIENGLVTGMLIATSNASKKIREMITPEGQIVILRMPEIADQYYADEDAELQVFG